MEVTSKSCVNESEHTKFSNPDKVPPSGSTNSVDSKQQEISQKPPTGQSPAILQSGCQSSRLDAQSRVTRGEKLTGKMTKDPVLREMQGMFNGT